MSHTDSEDFGQFVLVKTVAYNEKKSNDNHWTTLPDRVNHQAIVIIVQA